jgi:hypothetical protein
MSEQERRDTNPIYEKVELFVKQFHEKNVALKPEASKLIIDRTMGKDFFGRAITKVYSLADIIAEQMAEYIKVQELIDETVAFYSKPENKPTSMLDSSFINAMDIINGYWKRRHDVVIRLFENLERADTNNLIDEIGLGKKLKQLEQQNESKDRLIESLKKANKELKNENDQMHKLLPHFKTGEAHIGDVSRAG